MNSFWASTDAIHYSHFNCNYFPTELLGEIFLFSTESNAMKRGHLASVCRYWRSVITAMPHLWSTLRVGTWTETEQVTTWLQRVMHLKKVVIDTQGNSQRSSETLGCPVVHWFVVTWAIPICLKTHTWHVGVHNYIMTNYFGVVQPVLYHNPPNNRTLQSPSLWLSPIGFSLQRCTFSSVLGPQH